VSGRKRKEHQEEHENHERWLVSYADFITLLFAFFVVMYSVSRVDSKKLQQVVAGIRWAMHFDGTGGLAQMPVFEGPPSEGGGIAGLSGARTLNPEQRQAIEFFRRRLQNRIRPFVLEKSGATAVSVEVADRTGKIRLAAAEFFEAGESALRPRVLPVLDAIAEELVPLDRPLHVEGHTDGLPVSGTRFRDNWELSAARAATVASYLERAHRASPRNLRATGLADTQPLATDDTPEARERNRRVEMVVELEPPDAAPARAPRREPASLPFR
jgi:chemotaxis protein MotB